MFYPLDSRKTKTKKLKLKKHLILIEKKNTTLFSLLVFSIRIQYFAYPTDTTKSMKQKIKPELKLSKNEDQNKDQKQNSNRT